MAHPTVLRSPYHTEQWSALSAARRRHALASLAEGEELSVRELAEEIREREGDAADGPEADRSVVVDLRHVHLPVLSDADLVHWDEDRGLVERTDHQLYEDERFERLLESPDDTWDDVVECLADEQRRQVLAIVASEMRETSRDELAEELDARSAHRDPSTLSDRSALRSLHHVHLPKLAAADLVEYDADDGTVTYEGHPELGEQLYDL